MCGRRQGNDDIRQFSHSDVEFREQLKTTYPLFQAYVDLEFTDDDLICQGCRSDVFRTTPFGPCAISSCQMQGPLIQAVGYRWDTYVDRCRKVTKAIEMSESDWMCTSCWNKVRMCRPPYAPPVAVAPEPVNIATPDDSPRSTAAVAVGETEPTIEISTAAVAAGSEDVVMADATVDSLGISVSSDQSSKSIPVMYISADQSSAAYQVVTDPDDEDTIAQAPPTRGETCPCTTWTLPCDDVKYDKLAEGFHRLRESISRIPGTPPKSDNEDDGVGKVKSAEADKLPKKVCSKRCTYRV